MFSHFLRPCSHFLRFIRFSSCGSYYDTWLRIFPGTYQQNNGYASCADRNVRSHSIRVSVAERLLMLLSSFPFISQSYQGTNCASCDDCGGCGTRTILGIQITEAGWYTLLVEGCKTAACMHHGGRRL